MTQTETATPEVLAFRQLAPEARARFEGMAEQDERSDRLHGRPAWSDAQREQRAAYYAHHLPVFYETHRGW